MQNRPVNLFVRSHSSRSGGMWQVEPNFAARLVGLFAVIVLVFAVIGARLAYVQCALIDGFVLPSEQRFASYEPIPCRDGSILSAEMSVLAEDVERFQIRMHYRWLEEPADAQWLRAQALSRLSKEQRGERELIREAEAHVLEERSAMWDRLAALLEVSTGEMADRRQRIQQRIERMKSYVELRRADRRDESPLAAHETTPVGDTGLVELWWYRLVRALTTSPQRGLDDPLVLPEESDYYVIAEGLDLPVAGRIKDEPHLFPGLDLHLTTQRVYPAGPVACHVVGMRTPLDATEIEERKGAFPQGDPLGYREGDRVGRAGVERSYDRALRGVPGVRRVVRNRRGEILETEVVRAPRRGHDVELTVALPLQRQCETLLDKALGDRLPSGGMAGSTGKRLPRGGVIVVMKAGTGEVVAAAAAPRFNLNLYSEFERTLWDAVLADERRPMFSRVTEMAIAPGSVFKVLTALALLSDPNFHPEEAVTCRGYLDNPNSHRCYIFTHYGVGHGEVTLADALTQSCNVYFFDSARRTGPRRLVTWARRFGFGRPTGIDLPGESSGNVPSPEKPGQPWYPGDTLGLAIGQSRLTVTPLQIVRMMGAVANGGRLVVPHVARDIGDVSWYETAHFEPEYVPELGESMLGRVQDALTQVVANRKGTGYKYVRLAGVNIAGKTGTAETGRGDHAWFAGFVPAEAPKYAFVVVLEHGGGGGAVAGPVAKQVVQSLDDLGLLGTPRLSRAE